MRKMALLLVAVFTLSCSSEDDPMDQNPVEDPEPTIEGDYTGTWDDNLYTSFPVSTKISNMGGKRYGGPFFYSQNGAFVPCCEDSNDNGNITFSIKEDSIVNFVYNQKLEFFMGGCPGRYEGSGTVNSNGWLLIDFAGEDCEGSHTGGKIVFRK